MSRRKKEITGEPANVAEAPVRNEQVARAVSSEKVKITARVNSSLPDGTFVREGETVEVSKEYADRLRKENDKSFIIN